MVFANPSIAIYFIHNLGSSSKPSESKVGAGIVTEPTKIIDPLAPLVEANLRTGKVTTVADLNIDEALKKASQHTEDHATTTFSIKGIDAFQRQSSARTNGNSAEQAATNPLQYQLRRKLFGNNNNEDTN